MEQLSRVTAGCLDGSRRVPTDPNTLAAMIMRVELSSAGMKVTLDTGIATEGTGSGGSTFVVTRFVPHRVQRRGVELRLVIDGPGGPTRDDAALLKVVARAHCWFADLIEGRAASVHVLAERLGVTARYVQRVLPLAMLAPELVEQIAARRHPVTLTVDRLINQGPLPIRWTGQVARLDV